MLSFKEYSLLVESFDLLDKPTKLSPLRALALLEEYLKQKHADYSNLAKHMIKSYEKLFLFEYSENNEKYIIFFGKPNNEKYYEIHFNDIKHVDVFQNLGKLNSSQKLLSYIFSIIYYYGLKNSVDIVIASDEKNNRSKFYGIIADKIIKKYDLHYSTKILRNSLLITYEPDKSLLFTERFRSKI